MAQGQLRHEMEHRGEEHGTDAAIPPSWMVTLALVAGLLLRMLWLGSKSFWLDETLSIRLAGAPWRLWSSGFDDSHPPLYYALLHYWLPFGTSEFTLRLSSALVGSLAIPLSYVLASYLGGRRVAYTTVWLVALSPLLVWYAQELRSYSLLLVWGLVISLALARLVTRPHVGWWLLFVLAMAAALYTHYAALLLIPVQLGIIATLWLQRRLQRMGVWLWLLAWPVVVLLYWPWLTAPGMAAFMQMFSASDFYPIEFLALWLGISTTLAGALLLAGVMLALTAAAIVAIVPLRRGLPWWQRLAARPWLRYGVLLLVLLLVVVGVVPRLYTVKKMVVALWPYGLLLVAWLFPWQAANRVLVGVMLVASLAGALVNVAAIPKDQWRALATYIAANSEAADVIWVIPRYQSVPLTYYLDQSEAATGGPPATIQAVGPSMSDAELAALVEAGARVWLVYHAADVNLVDPDHRLQVWLDAHMTQQDAVHVFRIDAWLYAPQP